MVFAEVLFFKKLGRKFCLVKLAIKIFDSRFCEATTPSKKIEVKQQMKNIVNSDEEIHYKFVPIEDMPPGTLEQSVLIPPNSIAVFKKKSAKNVLKYCLMEKTEKTEKTDTFSRDKNIPKIAIFYTGEKNLKELDAAFKELKTKFASIGIKLNSKDVEYVHYAQGDSCSADDIDNYLKRSDRSAREEVLLASVGTFGCIIVYSDECLKNIDSEGTVARLLTTARVKISQILKKE
jgi:hypothetical protein